MRVLHCLAILALLTVGRSAVAKAKAKPAPAAASPAPAPAPAEPRQVHVALKDGQVLDGKLTQSDAYFMTVLNARGTRFDLPWSEIASVDGPDLGLDAVALRGHLSAEPTAVTSLVEPRSGMKALGQALWPGVLVHGWGHRYAGDNDTFVSLVGGEIFAVVIGGFGLNEVLGPSKEGETKDTAVALSVAGGAIFGLTWLWDLAFSPHAAAQFNDKKGLALEPTPTGAQLAYRF
jgi:hypothetical protein